MKGILPVIFLLGTVFNLQAQTYGRLWHATPGDYLAERGLPVLKPAHFSGFTVSETALKEYLTAAAPDPEQARIIDIPLPDGRFRLFRFWATPVMEKELALKYPGIATYTAEAVDDSRVTAKLDYTPFGFHAVVFDGAQTFLVDPYASKADGTYISYYKKAYSRPEAQRMICSTGGNEDAPPATGKLAGLPALQRLNGTTHKTYRLALAADSEYCQAVAGPDPTKVSVLAKILTSVNRVNGVFERELALTMGWSLERIR